MTGLAWSFIGLAAFSALLAGFQTLLFTYLVPMEALRAVFADAISLKLLPPATINVLAHLPGIGIALFIVSVLTLVVSIALLKRRNWARIAFGWIMIATAILHLAGLLLPFYLCEKNITSRFLLSELSATHWYGVPSLHPSSHQVHFPVHLQMSKTVC